MVSEVRVRADRDVCIGAGLCVLASESVFDQDDDGIVVLLQERLTDPETIRAAREAVANCPSGALSVEE
jgi:ferredoxin